MLVICPYVWHMMSSELGSASMSLLLLPLSQNESQEEGACALLTAKTPPSQEVHPCPFPVFPATLRGGFRAPEDSEAQERLTDRVRCVGRDWPCPGPGAIWAPV